MRHALLMIDAEQMEILGLFDALNEIDGFEGIIKVERVLLMRSQRVKSANTGVI